MSGLLKSNSKPNFHSNGKVPVRVTDRNFLILVFSVFVAGMLVSWL